MAVEKRVKENYEKEWKSILENKKGEIDKEQLMKELFDFSNMIRETSTVFCELTGNTLSYPTYKAETVLSVWEKEKQDIYNRAYQDGVDDTKEEKK